MKRFISSVLFLISQIACSADFTPATTDLNIVESYLIEKKKALSCSEFKEARRFMAGDINEDNKEDLAILYTLEGIGGDGNNYSFFLGVFERTNKGLKFITDAEVGGKSTRNLSFESIKDGILTFDTEFHWKDDAFCCPTGTGQSFYTLSLEKSLEEFNVASSY